MFVVISVAVGMILWVVLWGLGAKGFDTGMLFLLIVLGGATIKVFGRLLPGNRRPDEGQTDAAPFT